MIKPRCAAARQQMATFLVDRLSRKLSRKDAVMADVVGEFSALGRFRPV
ncbi:hypothetical protein [Halopolyspora algeriensis]|nr:hypothetical protein [Halopolyspora algeriensis]